MNSVNLRLENFEGPLDLLIRLIDENEIDIYDIPISELTDQYIAYIKTFAQQDMDSMSEFVLMAATLLEIKSKMLLPKLPKEDDQEQEDPRTELIERLIEYKNFKSVSDVLLERQEIAKLAFFKESDLSLDDMLEIDEKIDYDELLDGLTTSQLYEAFQEVLNRQEMKVDKVRIGFSSVKKDVYTMAEKITYIRELLLQKESVKFGNIFSLDSEKNEKIVTFLALLELIKVKVVYVTQDNSFGEIIIRKWKIENGSNN